MSAQTIPLSVEHLSYRYRTREEWALRDVSFDLRQGEILLIAGASGCGKTTLIRCINGLIPRSYKGGEFSGKILLNGRDPAPLSLAQISQTVGTVLQDPDKQIVGSYVLNEVAFGLENLHLPRAELLKRVDEILDYLGILHLRDHETYRLSGGEKQKVALAGVLAMRPSILLLDEPLAQLDPQSAQDALALIRRLADQGLTIIVIEHRVEDVMAIRPARALWLSTGEVRYWGEMAGFMAVADYRELKLPAPMIMEQVAEDGNASSRTPVHAPPINDLREDALGRKTIDERRKTNDDRQRTTNSDPSPVSPPSSAPDLSVVVRPSSAAATPAPLVQFKNVSFGYEPEHPVLHGVTAEINRGDVIALLGPNGAGKSTLIKHAIGLLKPTEGEVLVNGEDTRKKSSAQLARTLGYVFQSPTQMLFAPTVSEELAFGPRNMGRDSQQIDSGINLAVDMMNLQGLENYSPFSLSYGQQKRVSIAAIIAMQSRILVMDEPTAGQDYRNYTSFMDSILALPNFEAVVFITHDLDLAVMHANRVWLLSGGWLMADGTPEEILPQRELLLNCRVVPTTLLDANLRLFPQTGRFMSAERLARYAFPEPTSGARTGPHEAGSAAE